MNFNLQCFLFGHDFIYVNKKRRGWLISFECKRCRKPHVRWRVKKRRNLKI